MATLLGIMMKLTIVIPCYNEEKRIAACLDNLARQTVKPEIIVVDGGSTDRTRGIVKGYAKRHANTRLLVETGDVRSPANARNIGWKAANGDLVFFLDADGVIGETFTQDVIGEFKKHPEEDFVQFRCTPYIPDNFSNIVERALYYREERGNVEYGPIVMKKDVYKRIGFYDPKIGFGEDRLLTNRIYSGGIRRVGTSLVHSQSARLDLKSFAKRYMWYGRTMMPYLRASRQDRRVLYGAALSFLSVPSGIFFWLNAWVLLVLLACVGVSMARGIVFGARIYKIYKVKSPIFILPFTEIFAMFLRGIGIFQYLLGYRSPGRG